MTGIRKPAVSGYFYPAEKNELLRMIQNFVQPVREKEKAIAIVCPHAGYIYSGKTAGIVYSKITPPDTAVILGPNHHGYGEPYAVEKTGRWLTPLGTVEIDTELAELLLKHRYLEEDSIAHRPEHSVEVQVPFLQYLNPKIKIVPVVLSGPLMSPAWYDIGNAIGEAIIEYGKNTLIVASSDFTHYETREQAESKDRYAIEAILALDENRFAERVEERNITACGYAPIIAAIVGSRRLGAKSARLLDYRTSGDVSGDYDQVVGYAGIIMGSTLDT